MPGTLLLVLTPLRVSVCLNLGQVNVKADGSPSCPLGAHCPDMSGARARSGGVSPEIPRSRDPGIHPGDGGADIRGLRSSSLPWVIRFRIKWCLGAVEAVLLCRAPLQLGMSVGG